MTLFDLECGSPSLMAPNDFCEAALQSKNIQATLPMNDDEFVIQRRCAGILFENRPNLLLREGQWHRGTGRTPGDRMLALFSLQNLAAQEFPQERALGL
jgi:hypothetical protein